MTPVINFKHCVTHRQSLHPVAQFVVEHHAAAVEILVVYPHGQHKVTPFAIGNRSAPRHLLAGTKRAINILKIEVARVVGQVGQRHVSVEKLKSLTPVVIELTVKYRVITGQIQSLLSRLKIALYGRLLSRYCITRSQHGP